MPGIKDLFDDQESRTPEKIDRFAALNFSKETLSSISRLTQSTISEKDNEFTSKFTQGLLQDDKGSNVESTSTDVNLPPGGTSWMSFLLTTPTKPGASAGNSTFQSPAKEFLNLDSQSKSKMQEGDVKFKVSEEKNKEICIPEYLPIDIRVKLAISLIQLERKVNIQVNQ